MNNLQAYEAMQERAAFLSEQEERLDEWYRQFEEDIQFVRSTEGGKQMIALWKSELRRAERDLVSADPTDITKVAMCQQAVRFYRKWLDFLLKEREIADA